MFLEKRAASLQKARAGLAMGGAQKEAEFYFQMSNPDFFHSTVGDCGPACTRDAQLHSQQFSRRISIFFQEKS